MTDFLITEMTFYPWFTWLLVVLAGAGLGYVAVWAYRVQAMGFAWLGYRRQVWLAKAAVRRQLLENPQWDCAVCRDREALLLEEVAAGDDPPEYQHDDGPDEGYDWDGPGEEWSPTLAWGPPPAMPAREMAGLAEVLKRAHDLGLLDDDQLPGGPVGSRCTNRDCYRYGEDHAGACDVAPTMPAACYMEGPAMPPQPVREYLHPAIMDSLEAAGFSEHETNDGAVDSMFTRAQAREVEAMVTDGVVIPTDETGRSHHD